MDGVASHSGENDNKRDALKATFLGPRDGGACHQWRKTRGYYVKDESRNTVANMVQLNEK